MRCGEVISSSHLHAKFHHCDFKNVDFRPKNRQNGNFRYKIAPKGVYPLIRFIQNFVWGRASQDYTITPNLTVVASKMWPYVPKIAQNGNYWYKFAPREKFWGSVGKLQYRCTTTNFALCNSTIIVLTILCHSKAWQIKNKQKTSHFLVYSRSTTYNHHHTWRGDRGGPSHFCTS